MNSLRKDPPTSYAQILLDPEPVGETEGELIKWFKNPGTQYSDIQQYTDYILAEVAKYKRKYRPDDETIALYFLKVVDLFGAIKEEGGELLFFRPKTMHLCVHTLIEDDNTRIKSKHLSIYRFLNWRLPVYGLAEYVMQEGYDVIKVWNKILEKRDVVLKGSPEKILASLAAENLADTTTDHIFRDGMSQPVAINSLLEEMNKIKGGELKAGMFVHLVEEMLSCSKVLANRKLLVTLLEKTNDYKKNKWADLEWVEKAEKEIQECIAGLPPGF